MGCKSSFMAIGGKRFRASNLRPSKSQILFVKIRPPHKGKVRQNAAKPPKNAQFVSLSARISINRAGRRFKSKMAR